MVIPQALIPTEERRSINKVKLVITISITTLLALGTMGSLVIRVINDSKPAIGDKERLLVGYLSAFTCQKQFGRIKDDKGQAILSSLMKANDIDPVLLRDSLILKTAAIYTQYLDDNCQAVAINEPEEINKIYKSERRRIR